METNQQAPPALPEGESIEAFHAASEEKLSRYRHLYKALSHTNRAIMASHDRDTLFREICRVVVSYGKFCLAWIGLPDAEGFLKPVAYCGRTEKYLQSLTVSVDSGREDGWQQALRIDLIKVGILKSSSEECKACRDLR